MQVNRSSNDVKILYQSLEQRYVDVVNCPPLDTDNLTEMTVQDFLNEVVSKLGENLFLCRTMLEFLDDGYSNAGVLKLQSDYLFCHVRFFEFCIVL